jgi:hypothetical protein
MKPYVDRCAVKLVGLGKICVFFTNCLFLNFEVLCICDNLLTFADAAVLLNNQSSSLAGNLHLHDCQFENVKIY